MVNPPTTDGEGVTRIVCDSGVGRTTDMREASRLIRAVIHALLAGRSAAQRSKFDLV